MKSECLNIKGLNVWYKKDKPIIKDTNLLVPNHSVVGLIGRNGAGKTTLLKALVVFLIIGSMQLRLLP